MYQRSEQESENTWENLKQEALRNREQGGSGNMGDNQIADGAPGVEASSPSCWDPLHPPHHAVNSNPHTFWSSTGLFPSELVVTFGEHSTVRTIEITSVGIRRLEVMKSEGLGGVNTSTWEQMALEDVDDADGGIQRLAPNIPFGERASAIKLRIVSGHTPFVSIYRVSVTGAATAANKVSSKAGNKFNSSHSTRATDLGKGSLSSRLGGSPSSSPTRK